MNLKRQIVSFASLAVLLPGAGLIFATGGCVDTDYVSGGAVIGADDYDYYPGYEVYYSRRHHYYYYQDGRTWVRRPTPPRAFVRGPVVHMDFHDAPEHHHAEVVRRYPHNWRPDRRHHDDDRDDRRQDDDHPAARRPRPRSSLDHHSVVALEPKAKAWRRRVHVVALLQRGYTFAQNDRSRVCFFATVILSEVKDPAGWGRGCRRKGPFVKSEWFRQSLPYSSFPPKNRCSPAVFLLSTGP